MDSKARNVQLFAWSVTVLGTLWLLLRLPQLAVPWWLALTFLAAEVGAQWFSVAIPGGIRISMDFVVVFFVFLVAGPVPASLAIFVSCIFHKIRLKNAWNRVFFIAAQFIFATYLMAIVFEALGGRGGSEIVAWGNLFPLVAAVAAYVVVNDVLVGLYHILKGDMTWRDMLGFLWADLKINYALAPFSVLGVYLYVNLGVQGIILMVVLAAAFGWPLLVLLRGSAGGQKVGLEGKITAIGTIIVGGALVLSSLIMVVVSRQIIIGWQSSYQGLYDEALRTFTHQLLMPMIIVMLLIFGAVVFALRYIMRRIVVKPIRSTNSILRDLAESTADLSKRLRHVSTDELGDLTKFFNAFASKLENLVRSVISNANRVATTSEELAASTEEMSASQQEISSTIQRISQGTSTQVASVRETKDAVEEITASVEQVNSNAQMAALSASQALQQASDGGTTMESIVQQMTDIDVTMTRLSGVVSSLEKKAVEISRITELISSVAWRTNLLALNAAIEAARAGESGRGFSVVAIEVKKLAERTATATNEIDALIKEIQGEITQTVEAMREGVDKVAKGKELAAESNQAFYQIIDAVKHSADGVQQISEATSRQVEGAKKIAKAIDSVAMVAEEIASGMEQTAAAQQQQMASMEEMTASAQELAHAAEEMKNQGSSFVVKEEKAT
ncbi:MAG TPA: methyl-accepting chemotaxis protein [Candidatus Edwardsbacteria bacterium]|nr:methyl-accepting chemotaxis protein [Candidatus Edwardsbacteria bacterium]